MDKESLAYFYKRLIQKKQELEEILQGDSSIAQPVELDQTRQGRLSRMDAMQLQEMAKETKRRHEVEYKKTCAALQRMEEDEYGYCVITGDEIEYARLEADPAAPTCIAAARRLEKDS